MAIGAEVRTGPPSRPGRAGGSDRPTVPRWSARPGSVQPPAVASSPLPRHNEPAADGRVQTTGHYGETRRPPVVAFRDSSHSTRRSSLCQPATRRHQRPWSVQLAVEADQPGSIVFVKIVGWQDSSKLTVDSEVIPPGDACQFRSYLTPHLAERGTELVNAESMVLLEVDSVRSGALDESTERCAHRFQGCLQGLTCSRVWQTLVPTAPAKQRSQAR